MRLLFKAKYIILAILFLVLLLVGTKSGWLVQRYTFAKAIQHELVPGHEPKSESSADLRSDLPSDLRRCLRSCNPRDKALAERFLQNVALPLQSGEISIESKLSEIRKIFLEAASNYIEVKDVRSAVEVYNVVLDLNSRIQYEPERDLPFLNEIHTAIERLVARFPRNGHAYFILGKSLYLRNSRDVKSLAAFKKCLAILPTESACKDGFEKALGSYTQARCEANGLVPGVKFEMNKTDVNTDPLNGLFLNSDEISEVWAETSANEKASLMVRFTDSGMTQLRKAYRDGSANVVNLKIEDKTLATAPLSLESFLSSNAIKFADVGLEEQTLPVFEAVCKQPQRPELPQKLSL